MKLKYLIVGFIAGVFATIALTAGASTVYEKFTAVARPDYTLVVDGSAAKLNNAPVTINGSSYLPVREVATILDADVSFNSGTIKITTNKESEGDNVTTPTTDTTTNNPTETNSDEWVNINQLSELTGKKFLLTSKSEGVQVLFTEDESIVIEFNLSRDEEAVGTTKDGDEIRFFRSKGSAFINLEDLKSAGIID